MTRDEGQKNPEIRLATSLNAEDYQRTPAEPRLVAELTSQRKPQFAEMGEYLREVGGRGTGIEYKARYARIQESVGLVTRNQEITPREQLHYVPGETPNLQELLGTVREDDTLRITDYRGRVYDIGRSGEAWIINKAYMVDETIGEDPSLKSKPLEIRRYVSPAEKEERARVERGYPEYPENPYITLVEKGVRKGRTEGGHEVVVDPTTHNGVRRTSRIELVFGGPSENYIVLPSKIDIVPANPEVQEQVELAQWRIADSVGKIREMVTSTYQNIDLMQRRSEREVAFRIEDGKLGHVYYDTQFCELSFVVVEEHKFPVELSFRDRSGGYKRTGDFLGSVFRPFGNPEIMSPVEAAKEIDKYRYQIQTAYERDEKYGNKMKYTKA